jgi:hypothetical protein
MLATAKRFIASCQSTMFAAVADKSVVTTYTTQNNTTQCLFHSTKNYYYNKQHKHKPVNGFSS